MYYRSIVRSIVDYKINFVIKILILSDFLIFVASNLLSPIFAIFILQKISGATIETVGICATIFYASKAIFEIPVGKFIDRTVSEKDDLYSALLGTILAAGVYLSYCFLTSVWQIYAAQFVLGLGAALAYPGWYAMFTRHIDGDKKAVEWSVYDVSMALGIAMAASLGAFIADKYGFYALFIVISAVTVVGALSLLMVKNKIYFK